MKSQPAKKAPKDKQESKKTNGKPTPGKWEEMNRKQRREMMRQMQSPRSQPGGGASSRCGH
jgi:hypothetical protein